MEREKNDLHDANETMKRAIEQNEREIMFEREQRKKETYVLEDRLRHQKDQFQNTAENLNKVEVEKEQREMEIREKASLI